MNRKVLNATPVIAKDGVQMKSKVEKSIYETLLDLGYSPRYESETFIYWKGGRPKTLFYDLSSKRENRLNMKKFIDMKYTPDIIFMYDGIKVIIEVKGWENDIFPLKKKLFRTYLDTLPYPVVYAEIFTKKQLLQFMQELEAKAPEIKKQKETMIVQRKRNNCIAFFYNGANIDELIETFEQEPLIDDIEEYKQTCLREGRATLSISPIGEFYLEINHWLVKDLVNGLCFKMNDDEFRQRYDIISE